MIKEEQIVKLVTVTITDIFAQNELVTLRLVSVALVDDKVLINFTITDTTLPSVCNPSYTMNLHINDLQEWIGDGTDVDGFVEKLELKLVEALQVKTERKD